MTQNWLDPTPAEIDEETGIGGKIASVARIPGGKLPFFALLDNIRSLYNVGSIFRTSDAAGLAGLYLAGYTPCPPRKEIEKTALGATASVPWEHVKDPVDLLLRLKSGGVRICSIERTDGSVPYTVIDAGWFPLCLVVGNELTGVRREVLAVSDAILEIPMLGKKRSLNAAVAFGVAAFRCVAALSSSRRSLP